MTVKYTATFEFDEAPNITVKGTVTAGSLQTLLSRAGKEAKLKHPNKPWRSFVVVLER